MLITPPTRLRDLLRRWLARDGIVLAILFAFALATIAPVVLAMQSCILGWGGDNEQYVYMTGWMAKALLRGQSPFYDPQLNYPDGLQLATTDVPYSSLLAAAPLTWLFGPVFGYNAILCLCALLSGYFAYLWVLNVTGSRFGGWVAGTAFLLSPYRIAHSYGHLQLVATFGLPLFFWALDRMARPGARKRHTLFLAGAAFLVGSSSQYYLVICVIAGAAYMLLGIAPKAWLQVGWKVALAIAIGAGISALPYLSVLGSNSFQAYNVLDTRVNSADPLDFLQPSRLHPLWGLRFELMRPEPLWIEKTLYLGTVALALALIGLCWPCSPWRREGRIWLVVALVGALFALGTDLHIGDQPLAQEHPFWLPAYYLAFLPGASLMREWLRFAIIPILFVALLAGLAAARIAAPSTRGRRFLLAAIAALLVLDLLPGKPDTIPMQPRPIDLWLARQPGEFAVAFLPGGTSNYTSMFGSLFHNKHLPAYNHPQHLPPAFRRFGQLLVGFPKPAAIQALRQLKLRYLLLDRRQYDGKRQPLWSEIQHSLSAIPGVKIRGQQGGFVVVEIL